MSKLKISHLEWHVAHSCNLTCVGCGHFSNHRHTGIVKYDELESWYKSWAHRLDPETIDILGGEPLLNKDIYNILFLTRKYWPDCENLNLQTNGFLLYKYPDLPKVLEETNISISLSKHSTKEAYMKKFAPAEELLLQWKKDYNIKAEVAPCHTYWFEIYKGYGNNMMPYEDNDAQKSWDNCITGQDCFQLLDNEIYKCAPLAYLPFQKKLYNLSPKWDPYLKYKPITADCTDKELAEFFARGCESFCSMCPSNPKRMDQQGDPTTPRSHYENIKIQQV